MDSKHEITIRQVDNRGRNFLIGVAVLATLVYFLRGGQLLALAGFFTRTPVPVQGFEGGYESVSVTGILLPIVIQLIGTVGAVAVALWTGVWYVLWDVFTGLGESVRMWRAKNAALASATAAAEQQALSAASATATVTALGEVPLTESGEPITLADMAHALQAMYQTLKEHGEKLESLQEFQLQPPPPAAPKATQAAKPKRSASKHLEPSAGEKK